MTDTDTDTDTDTRKGGTMSTDVKFVLNRYVYIYVTMTDDFMSGWGPARRKINKLVISCRNQSEQIRVVANARRRGMKYVYCAYEKPRYDESRYYVSWHGREQGDYKSWFE